MTGFSSRGRSLSAFTSTSFSERVLMKKTAFVLAASWFGVTFSVPAWAEKPLRVVTTLSTFADLVEQIGGDRVEVSYVAPPRFNPHFIEPRPSDVLKLKRADLFIHGGLDLELWRWPLVDAAGNPDVRPGGSREVVLSQGVKLLEVPDRPVSRAEGDIHLYGNPHYWLDPENGKIMLMHIAKKLSEIDPANTPQYRQRLEEFTGRLDKAIGRWRKTTAPLRGRKLVAYHNAWVYLTEFLGIKTELFLEPKPGIPPTPRQMLLAEQKIREEKISALIQASYAPLTAARQLARKTGVQVVTLCQNVGELPGCPDYLSLIDHNIQQILQAAQGKAP